jgi:PHD/YefM family antitoxin component YafN of YafNO toxin-antitoxin module
MTTAAKAKKKVPRFKEVMPVSEARREFSTILKSFTDQTQSEPVYIGAHRKAEAVLIPVSVWEYMLDLIDDIAISRIIAERKGGETKIATFEEFQREMLAAWNKAHQ